MKKVNCMLFFLFVHFTAVNAQWVEQQTNQTIMVVTEFSPVGNANWALDLNWQNRQTFSKTIDNGNTWTTGSFNLNTSSVYRIRTIHALNADTAWMPVIFDFELQKGGVYKTTDGGVTWNQQTTSYNTNNTGKFPSLVYFWNANDGVTVGSIDTTTMRFDIFVTSDGGNSWNQIPDIDNPPSTLEDYRLPPLSYRRFRVVGNTIWFITLKNKIYKSTDKGYHWTKYNTPAQSDYMNYADCVFAFKDENNGLMVDSYVNTPYQYKLYETHDGAQTWQEKTHQGIPFGWDINYIPGTPDTYIASGYTEKPETSGLCYTEDGGATWIKHPSFDGLYTGAVIFQNDSVGWIGSEEGRVYRTRNFKGENPIIKEVGFTSKSSIDVLFNHELDPISMQDTANYYLLRIGTNNRIYLSAAIPDSVNPARVHLILKDTVISGKKYFVKPSKNIVDNNGFHLLTEGLNNKALYETKKISFMITNGSIPLEEAKVVLIDSKNPTDSVFQMTDSTGNALFEKDPGNYSFFITKQGYRDTIGNMNIETTDSNLVLLIALTPFNGYGEKMPFSQIRIYPNPASCWIHFSEDLEAEIQIYDLSGILIQTIAKPRYTRKINISHLNEGMYIFRVKHQSSETRFKIQVKK